MSASNNQPAYSATKTALKERGVVRLFSVVSLLALLVFVLCTREESGMGGIQKTFVVAVLLAFFEIDFKASKKNAHKYNTPAKKWCYRVICWALIGVWTALVACYIWVG